MFGTEQVGLRRGVYTMCVCIYIYIYIYMLTIHIHIHAHATRWREAFPPREDHELPACDWATRPAVGGLRPKPSHSSRHTAAQQHLSHTMTWVPFRGAFAIFWTRFYNDAFAQGHVPQPSSIWATRWGPFENRQAAVALSTPSINTGSKNAESTTTQGCARFPVCPRRENLVILGP